MKNTQEILELKAKGFDILANIQFLQGELQKVNSRLAQADQEQIKEQENVNTVESQVQI